MATAERQSTFNEGLRSSLQDEWATPDAVIAALRLEFGEFDLDPCATPENAKAGSYFTVREDGLRQPWHGRVFMNPPYGREIGLWVQKAWESHCDGAIVICLLPARTDTAWWHDYCMKGEIRFLRGRLKFGDAKFNAPFPSAVVIFRERPSFEAAEIG